MMDIKKAQYVCVKKKERRNNDNAQNEERL